MARSSRKRKRKPSKGVGDISHTEAAQKSAQAVGFSPEPTTKSANLTRSNDSAAEDSTSVEKSASELLGRLENQIEEISDTHVGETDPTAGCSNAVAKQLDAANVLLTENLAEFRKEQERLDDKRRSLETLQCELASRESKVSRAEGELHGRLEALNTAAATLQQDRERVTDKAAKTASQRRLIAKQLLAQRDELRQQSESAVDSSEVAGLRDQLDSANEKIELLEHEIARIRDVNNENDSADRDAMNELRAEFDAAIEEAQELRLQNQDLAAQLATSQVAGAGSSGHVASESMTWEERKESMLRQLDAEDAGCPSDEESTRRIEIEGLLERTSREVERRDEEIAELRCLLAEQSEARGDVAVGGAAVLQMLDQDELIAEERAKLQRIQSEWEEKLRQAEIDVSLERARLARERIELEQQLADHREAEQNAVEGETKGRRWLARLGLADDE